jgi:MraZ protein
MFSSSSRLTIDDKGRLAIPARARAELISAYGSQIAITVGPECIEIYPAAVFRKMAEAIPRIADRAKRMQVMRMFVGHAVECEPDAQGRVLVPAVLRDKMALGSDVMLVGAIDHFELWPAASWLDATSDQNGSYADALAALVVP